jgi:hypothetical protein
LSHYDFLDVVQLTRAFTERRGAKISRLLEDCMDDIYHHEIEVGAGILIHTPIASYPFYDNGSSSINSNLVSLILLYQGTTKPPRMQYDAVVDIDTFLVANNISPLNSRLLLQQVAGECIIQLLRLLRVVL